MSFVIEESSYSTKITFAQSFLPKYEIELHDTRVFDAGACESPGMRLNKGPHFVNAAPFPIAIRRLLQVAQELAHAARSLIDILLGHRVRNPDMLGRAEGFTRNRDHVRLVQQPRR